MKTWPYIIESEHAANPELILFPSFEALQRRFVEDIISDERDPATEVESADEEPCPRLSYLIQQKEQGEPIEQQYKTAVEIYEAVNEEGGEMPYYHGYQDREGIEVPQP